MLRIKALILLTIFSFSAVGSTFEVHYCKGEVMDVSFIGEAVCAMHDVEPEKETKHCHLSTNDSCHKVATGDTNYQKEDCCQTETVTVINGNDFQTEKHNDFSKAVVLSLFYPFIMELEEQDANTEYEYHEPEREYNRQVAFQTFLI